MSRRDDFVREDFVREDVNRSFRPHAMMQSHTQWCSLVINEQTAIPPLISILSSTQSILLPMTKAELVFIPSPGLSHLVATVEAAKLLLHRDHRLSIAVLIMKIRKDAAVDDYTEKTSSSPETTSRLRFIHLPNPDTVANPKALIFEYMDSQITYVRDAVSNLIKHQSEFQIAGLVLDMFCTKFIEVADEFGIPSYVFFTSGACALGSFQYVQSLKYEQDLDLTQYKNSDVELNMPCFSKPVPVSVLPAVFLNGGTMADVFLSCFRRINEAKGIMVNTFYELESYAIDALSSDGKTPKLYPVGPILNSSGGGRLSDNDDVKKWLDDQPESSVVFLCFGTMGSFEEEQVREIALALENSGKRFLWSLRKPGAKGSTELVKEYENFEEVLPEGFLERTKGIGKVIGWAAQVAVLSHPAVGGFVSHCGWNSTLESVWCGVPIATLPLYAEQQLNAFLLVKEKGLAEMIRVDYKLDVRRESPPEIVGAEEIEAAIRRLMAEEGGSGVREKVKEMQNKARVALEEGGSSYNAQCLFIEDVIRNMS